MSPDFNGEKGKHKNERHAMTYKLQHVNNIHADSAVRYLWRNKILYETYIIKKIKIKVDLKGQKAVHT